MSARPLAVGLDHLDGLLRCAILRLRATYELSLDEFRGLYVSDEQVDALLRAQIRRLRARAADPGARAAQRLGCARGRACPGAGGARAGADGAGSELDRKYESLFAYLNNDVTLQWPTADLALRVLGDGPALRRAAAGQPAVRAGAAGAGRRNGRAPAGAAVRDRRERHRRATSRACRCRCRRPRGGERDAQRQGDLAAANGQRQPGAPCCSWKASPAPAG